jgi:hypothetical protein
MAMDVSHKAVVCFGLDLKVKDFGLLFILFREVNEIK